jgi:hypothetical protein
LYKFAAAAAVSVFRRLEQEQMNLTSWQMILVRQNPSLRARLRSLQ